VNDIVRCWKNLEKALEEEELFQTYARVRGEYASGVQAYLKGDISKAELESLFLAERETFERYRKLTMERPGEAERLERP